MNFVLQTMLSACLACQVATVGIFYRAALALSVGECRVQFGCFHRNILRRKLARLSNKAPHLLCLPTQVACGGFVDPLNSRTRSDRARRTETRSRTAKSVREVGPLMFALFFCKCPSLVVQGLCPMETYMGVNRNCKTPMPQPYDIAQEVGRLLAFICAFCS